MKRIGTIVALTAGLLVGIASPAFAGDAEEYVSGHALRGEVILRSTNPGSDCATRRALLVSNMVVDESYNRYDGRNGSGWVCVTQRGYDDNPVSAWWSGPSRGPVG
jgi:hypothetical protein